MLCQFLPYIIMNQPQGYMCPLPLEPPSHLPFHPPPLGCHRELDWVPCVTQQIPTGCLFYIQYIFPYYSLHSSFPFLPTPFPQVCSLCLHLHWYPANRFISIIFLGSIPFSSFQFSRSVVSDSLQPHEPQHARPPCPSPTPGVHPNPCLLSQWCHPAISSSVPFSSCPQSFPASGSFPMSQFFTSGGVSVLEFQLQHQSFQWTPRTDLL